LDQALALQQRKHDKLVTLKKAMLQKMFPKNGATIPEIRFKGFDGNWESQKLGDITQSIQNNSLSREKLNYTSGEAKNIHYGDILVRFGETLDPSKPYVPFITDIDSVIKLRTNRLQSGDVIIADAAEDFSVGKCTELINVNSRVVVAGLHTIAIRPTLNFAPAFLGYFMNSSAYHGQLLPLMQGTKVLSISKTALKETRIFFPKSFEEQQKIGSYFQKLNKLINKQATQIKKLKQIKSACLERMFV
jgi:type I restriction enzyme S subunit